MQSSLALTEAVHSALEQYLNDNGAAAVCKTHIDPLTIRIVQAVTDSFNKEYETSSGNFVSGNVRNVIEVRSRKLTGELYMAQQDEHKILKNLMDGQRIEILLKPVALA